MQAGSRRQINAHQLVAYRVNASIVHWVTPRSIPLVKNKPNLFQISSVLGLSTVGPRPMRIRRIKQHLTIIGEDDALLLQENAISSLRQNDLRDALEERGM